MARLIPNPMSDVTAPLSRIEASIDKLGDRLEDVQTLPRIDDHLAEVNRGLAAVVESLGEIRAELQRLQQTVERNGGTT